MKERLPPGSDTELILESSSIENLTSPNVGRAALKKKATFSIIDTSADPTSTYRTAKGKFLAPFTIYERTGSLYSASLGNYEINDYHHDNYNVNKNDFTVPMQGPFTEKLVGGNLYRHVDLYTEVGDRPEPWKVEQDLGLSNTKALIFNNISTEEDRLVFPATPTWNFGEVDATSALSVSGWYKRTATDSTYHLFNTYGSKEPPAMEQWQGTNVLYVGASSEWRALEGWTTSGTSLWRSVGPHDGLPLDEWTHVVWVHDASTVDGGSAPALYINGVAITFSDGILPCVGNYSQPSASGETTVIGGWGAFNQTPMSGFFGGSIDEWTFWKKALSAEEVAEIYNDGCVADLQSSDANSDNSLVTWLRMGDTAGDTDGIGGTINDVMGSNDATGSCAGSSPTVGPQFTTDVVAGCDSGLKFVSQPLALPQSTYYRDFIAKSPMNIKNIKVNSLGNYTSDWEVVHTMGRRENSIQFVKDEGFDLMVDYISSSFPGSPLNNVEKIVRGRYESVFVNRFSAPGDPSTMGDADGGWGLDRYSAELSPNNDLNTRNSNVRNIYRDILSSHVNQFGYFSATNVRNTTGSTVNALDYSGVASPYQVNRNAGYRSNPTYDASAVAMISTSSVNFATGSAATSGGYRVGNTAAIKYIVGVDDFSIAVWVKPTATEDDPATLRPIISYSKHAVGQYHILWGLWAQNGKFYAGIDATGSTDATIAANPHVLESPLGEYDLDTWYLLTLNSTPGPGAHEAELGFTVGNATSQQLTRSTSTFVVGSAPSLILPMVGQIGTVIPNSLMNMELDDISIYNINLSEAQVNDIFTCGPNDITQFFSTSDIEAYVLMGDTIGDTHESLTDISVGGSAHNFSMFPMAPTTTNLSLVSPDHSSCSLEPPCNKVYDNYYVQHNIPRNDYRYAWVTASTISDQCLTAAADMEFVSASDFGSYALSPRTWGTSSKSTSNYLYTDFVGLNNHIYDFITPSEGLIGYSDKGTPLAGERIVLAESFVSQSMFSTNKGLDPDLWDIQSGPLFSDMSLRSSSVDGVNWIVGFGGGEERALLPRYISTVQTYETPLSINFRYAHGEFQDSPPSGGMGIGYDLDYPGTTEPLNFFFSQDDGETWVPHVRLTASHATEGDTLVLAGGTGFMEYTASFHESLGPLKFRWEQSNYSTEGGTEDNWGLDNVNIKLTAQYLNRLFVPDVVGDPPTYQPQVFNALMLHRNGPYQYPSWKQIRGFENPLVRYYRANNIITVSESPLRSFYESPIISKYKPLVHNLKINSYEIGEDGEQKVTNKEVYIESAYGNNLSHFSHDELNQAADTYKLLEYNEQPYDIIKKTYLNNSTEDINNAVNDFLSLTYAETIYPAEQNLVGKNVNRRIQFECKFWKDSRTDRNLVNSSTNSQNIKGGSIFEGTYVISTASFGGALLAPSTKEMQWLSCLSQSIWPLDARFNFTTADTAYNWVTELGHYTPNTCGHPSSFYPHYIGGEGELQSPAPQLHGQMKLNEIGAGYFNVNRPLFPGLQYARRQTLPMSASTMAFSGYARGFDILGGSTITSSVYMPTSSISRIFGGDTKWEAGEQAGKNPFYYKDYNHYREDMKGKSFGYSLLPEFRISELMRKYITELDENFLSSDINLFSLTGSELENSGDTDFYKVYSHSDFMKYFDVFESEQDASEITLKCKAKIKFIPYGGFYPANRTVQLGTIFSQSYGKYVSNVKDLSGYIPTSSAPLSASATGSAQMNNLQFNVWNTYLQPFMKPGILFNTIKSGIAVDYPIFTGSFSRVTDLNGTIDGAPSSYSGSYITELFFHKRAPFEALINPEIYMKDTPIVNMEVHPSAAADVTASWGGQGDNLFKYAINNFLAEVPEFFLKGANMTTFVSKPENSFSTANSGTYAALVRLRKSVKSGAEVYRNEASSLYTKTPVNWNGTSSMSELQNPISFSPETLTMYSRPSAFGPPCAGFAFSSSASPELHPRYNSPSVGGSNNGYNMPFTPPYYDGSAWAIMTFEASERKKYTLEEIFDRLSIKYTRALTGENWVTGSTFTEFSANYFNFIFTDDCTQTREESLAFLTGGVEIGSSKCTLAGPQFGSLLLIKDGVSPCTGSDGLHSTGSVFVINQNAMQVSASVNLLQQTDIPSTVYNALSGRPEIVDNDPNKKVKVWAIQPKFETPILNFIDADMTLPTYGSESCAKGMWHQYGRLPIEDEGIYLDLIDIPDRLYETFGIPQPESLIDLVGFTPGQRKLGQVAETKEISEAVVAVPFIYKGNEKRFFKLDKTKIRDYVTEIENKVVPEKNSVSDMVTSMGNYVFPPTMDFYTNEEIDPFAMYIFEFKHTLTQQDLADIWQNLPPDIGTTFEEKETTISHSLLTDELLSGDNMREGNIRWMVFKVKKRAQKDYFSKIYGSDTKASQKSYSTPRMKELEGKNIQSKKNIPDYSYNWPYDFFSLVELAQLEEEIVFKEEED